MAKIRWSENDKFKHTCANQIKNGLLLEWESKSSRFIYSLTVSHQESSWLAALKNRLSFNSWNFSKVPAAKESQQVQKLTAGIFSR